VNKDGKNFALKKKTDICVSRDSLARVFGMDLWLKLKTLIETQIILLFL